VSEPFSILVHVRYAECDMQGHVFNGHYLTWFDMAHTGLLPKALQRSYRELVAAGPQVTLDDGADLLITAHQGDRAALERLVGGIEETATGLVRLRRLEQDGELAKPVLAANEARTERALNDRHGTGQSAIDGIVRAMRTGTPLATPHVVTRATATTPDAADHTCSILIRVLPIKKSCARKAPLLL